MILLKKIKFESLKIKRDRYEILFASKIIFRM